MGKATTPRDSIDSLIKTRKDVKKQYGIERQNYSGVSGPAVGNLGGSGGASNALDINSFITKAKGGQIIQHIAFFPKTIEVSSGSIDLTDSSAGNFGNNTTNINVIGQGNAPDDVNTITAGVEGQLLVLKAAGYQITLKDGTGNLVTPAGADYVIEDDEGVILIYDVVGAGTPRWMVLGGTGAGGGIGTEVPDWTQAHKANGFSFFLDADDDTLIEGNTDDEISFHIGGTPDLVKFTTTEIQTALTIIPSSTSINLGSSTGTEQFGNAFIDEIIFSNNTTFSSSVASIGSESGGEIVINAPTSQTIHMRIAGVDQGEWINGGLVIQPGKQLLFDDSSGYNASINKLFGQPLTINSHSSLGTEITNGDLNVTAGDIINSGDLRFGVGQSSTDLVLTHTTGIYTQLIRSNDGGIEIHADSGNDIEFKIAGTIVADVRDTGIQMNPTSYISPRGSGNVIGISPTSIGGVPTDVGTVGTIILPHVLSPSTPSTAVLDGWFGDESGSCGYATTTGGGVNLRLYIKDTTVWRYWNADGFI